MFKKVLLKIDGLMYMKLKPLKLKD